MRVATISIYSNSKSHLGQTLTNYTEAVTTVTTGKKIQSPSDDPVGYSRVMDIDSTLSQLDQLHSNISTGLEWLNTTESTLDSVLDTISEVKQLSIAAINGTYNDEDYTSAAAQVDELLEQLLDYANTNVNGHYLFSGTNTDTQPYTVDETAALPEDVVTYSGNDSAFTISLGSGSRSEVSYYGIEVFGDDGTQFDLDGDGTDDTYDDLFSLLIAMREDLASADPGANLDTIMTKLDEHYENVNNLISEVGIKTNRLETKESVVSQFELTLTEQKSNLEDVDLTEAATDLALRETAYQAALSATSSIMSISLADYL